jgi:hypothetical protein
MIKKASDALKKYFVPHDGNDNKPHILRPRTIAFVVVIALVAESAFVFGAKYVIPQSKLFGIIEVNALVDETNQNRVENGLPDLEVSPLLTAAAQDKANDEASKGYFAHTSPQGLTPWYWFQQVGYNFDYAGENLAVNFSDSQDVTTAWMNSPEHRANILSTDFTQIGMATAQGVYEGEPTIFVVEEFGTPAPAAAPTPFVDTASAATTPAPVVSTPTPAPTPAPVAKPKPVVKAPAKTVVAKPVATPAPAPVAVATVPVVVAMQSSSAPAVQQTSIAVQSEAPQSIPATSLATTSASAPSVGTTAAATPLPAQSNIIQQVLSDPKALANDFYLFVMLLFLIALMLNIFINIRVQYPRLIAGGLLVIVTAGLCIMLNQNIGFLHTIIL